MAESIAMVELRIKLECPTTEDRCRQCLESGQASEEKPGLKVLGNVTAVCPPASLKRWVGFTSWITSGKPRGLGDVVALATKAVGIKPCGGCTKRQAWLNEKVPRKDQ